MSKQKYVLKRNYEKTGALLQKVRQSAGLTQRDVSNHLGYSSAQFISNFERGIAIPPISKLKKLQKFMKLSIDEFLKTYLAEEGVRIRTSIK